MVHKRSPYGASEAGTIEVRHEQIAAGLPVLLHVRRGSESALNQLLTDAGSNENGISNLQANNEQTKRWSAAAPLSQEPRERYSYKKDDGSSSCQKMWSCVEENENEERGSFPPRRSRSSGFSRDNSNRLSMQFVGDTGSGLKWVDAADRVATTHMSLSLPREHRKKEPLTQANSQHVLSSLPNGVKYYDNTEYITFRMDDEALGIHVVPDYDQSGNDRGLLVQRIEPGGKVDRDGRLAVSDRIIEINDNNLLHQPFHVVQEIFRDSLHSPELKLRVVKSNLVIPNGSATIPAKKELPPPVYPKPTSKYPHNKENMIMVEGEEKSAAKCSKVATVSPTRKVPSTVTSSGGNILMAVNTRKIGKKLEIELVKGSHGLGFSITTRDNPVGGNCPIYIKNILPKGAAVEDGRLRSGDRLLSVNGNDVIGKTQSEIVAELRNVQLGGIVRLLISRQEDVASKIEESPQKEAPVGNATLKSSQQEKIDKPKKNLSQGVDQSSIFPWRQKEVLTFDIPVHDTEKAGLGISVKGKTSTNTSKKQNAGNSVDMGIFINSILHGGAVSKDGRLRTNDQLLSVNGVSLVGQSNSVAMDTLRRAVLHTEGSKPGAITLTVARKINSGHHKQQRRDSSSSLLTDSEANTETFGRVESDSTTQSGSNNTSGNSEVSSDSTVIFVGNKNQSQSPSNDMQQQSLSSRNPIVERLTGQTSNMNALRNESYYRATHHQTMLLMGRDVAGKFTSPTVNQSPSEMIIIEEDAETPYSPAASEQNNTNVGVGQQRGSTSTQTTDATYCSQLSLDDATAAGFARDAFGRRSMSEKRHATLDAKSTDTYQRNKRLREEREKQKMEENKRQGSGLVKVNSTESIPKCDRKETVQKHQLGPSLGMKKSSSLESLQTMVQEIQMAEDSGMYRRSQMPTRVIRGRGCNESFRAAVDRSYEGPVRYTRHNMEPVPEDDGCQFPPRQSSLNSQLDCKLMKQQHKKKSSLLKGLGSMFRFGRHRKPAVLEMASSQPSGNAKPSEEEKEHARRVALEEQQRIQEQYKILMQRQMDMQHLQQQQIMGQYMTREIPVTLSNPAPTSYNIPNSKAGNPDERHQRIQYPERGRSHFQQDVRDEYYPNVARRSFRQSEFEPNLSSVNRLSGRQMYPPEMNRYSHYVNYEEIQQHLSRRQQHYHSQRRENRELQHRPVSNFYEYESVQAMMQNYGMMPPPAYTSPPMPITVNGNFIPYDNLPPFRSYDPAGSRGSSYRRYQPPSFPPQNMNIVAQRNYQNRTNVPSYLNICSIPPPSQPLLQGQGGPFVTHVTIRENHYNNATTSLGTKV